MKRILASLPLAALLLAALLLLSLGGCRRARTERDLTRWYQGLAAQEIEVHRFWEQYPNMSREEAGPIAAGADAQKALPTRTDQERMAFYLLLKEEIESPFADQQPYLEYGGQYQIVFQLQADSAVPYEPYLHPDAVTKGPYKILNSTVQDGVVTLTFRFYIDKDAAGKDPKRIYRELCGLARYYWSIGAVRDFSIIGGYSVL